jgi:hypothetical protein
MPKNREPRNLAEQVYRDYRCALYHTGSTKGALRVKVRGRMFAFEDDHQVTINRTSLHKNLQREFDKYLDDLRGPGREELRRNFKTKMDAICGL